MISDRDDACLIWAAMEGGEDAFGELARRYRKAAFGVAFARLGEYEAASDAAQEALVTAWMQLPLLREPARFAGWLCGITNNIALMALRRRRSVSSLDSPELADIAAEGPEPPELAERADALRSLRQALSQLAESDRLAVILHYLSGYSHEEIAQMLGASASSVKTRLYRARRKLREEMISTMETIQETLPDVEVTDDLLERTLRKFDAGDYGVVAHLAGTPGTLPGMPQFTTKTRDAVQRIAVRLRTEGCSWLYAPVHLPDGSPALPIFRDLGFQTETEAHWYERDLATKLPAVPPLEPGLEARRLADARPSDVLALLRRTIQKHAPDAINEDDATRILRGDEHSVSEASLAAYRGDELVAIVSASQVRSWVVWKYEPGTGVLGRTVWDESAPASVIAHLIGLSLKALKKARLQRAVSDMLHPEHSRALIDVLESLGFRYVRSQWNLKLRL